MISEVGHKSTSAPIVKRTPLADGESRFIQVHRRGLEHFVLHLPGLLHKTGDVFFAQRREASLYEALYWQFRQIRSFSSTGTDRAVRLATSENTNLGREGSSARQ